MKRILSTLAMIAMLAGGMALSTPSFAQGTKKKAEDKAAATEKAAEKAADKGAKGAEKGSTVPDSERCIAKTQDGDRCKRKAADGSKYCWQHDPNRKAKGKKKA
ncbi:MAG: hypothetical protein U0Q16_31890 [Bryobacteraceae bacterium]